MRTLLVEGTDDEHVVKAFFGRHGLPHLDKVKQKGGWTKLLDELPVEAKASGLKNLGIIIDADTNAEGRWTAIRHRLTSMGYVNVDNDLPKGGLVIPAPEATILPKIGVWIMPDNQDPGILENFVSRLIPDGDALYEYAVSTVNSIPRDIRLIEPVAVPKAMIHTWLAWQKEPGQPLGKAITACVLRTDGELAAHFVRWLRDLYDFRA